MLLFYPINSHPRPSCIPYNTTGHATGAPRRDVSSAISAVAGYRRGPFSLTEGSPLDVQISCSLVSVCFLIPTFSTTDLVTFLKGRLDLLIELSVIEAVEVKSGSDGFVKKMRNGKNLRCVHNNPHGGPLPDYAPHPAIVLKMEDGSDLLLPIIVLEMPSILLMAAVRNVQIARPTIYQVVKEMIDKMGYQVQLVRVTKRVHETYFAQLYLTKAGNEKECISFDLRPSDAINMAVRCKVPIQVNRHLAYSDGMKVIEPSKVAAQTSISERLLFTELDSDADSFVRSELDNRRSEFMPVVDPMQWQFEDRPMG